MKKIIISIFSVIIIVSVISTALYYNSLIDITSQENIISHIDSSNIKILKTAQKDDFYAVCYLNNGKDELKIFGQSSVFKNRYKEFGGANTTTDFGSYNFYLDDVKKGEYTLYVLYGGLDNKLNAETVKVVDNDKKVVATYDLKDEYLLEIIKVDNEQLSYHGEVFDKDGNLLETF